MIKIYKSKTNINGETVKYRIESQDFQTIQGWGKKLNYTSAFRTFDVIDPVTKLSSYVNFDMKAFEEVKPLLEGDGVKLILTQYYSYNDVTTFLDTYFAIGNIFVIFEEDGKCVILGTNGTEYYVQNTLSDIKTQLLAKNIKLCQADVYIDGINQPAMTVYLVKDGMGQYSNAGLNSVNGEIITKLFSKNFGMQYISRTSATVIDTAFAVS